MIFVYLNANDNSSANAGAEMPMSRFSNGPNTNIARFGIFTEKTLVSKKFVLKTLVNVVLKKLDTKHIVTDNFNL